jgi:D-3-phosphoglycerate dehydrogenase
MGKKVLIWQDITDPGKDYLLERGYELVIGGTDIIEAARDCDAILARTARYSRELIESAPKLKVIARHGVGYDNIDVAAASERGVVVCIAATANALSVAEHTMALILECAKSLVTLRKEFHSGNWNIRNCNLGFELEGKTLSLLGCGRIGALTANMAAHGFGMRVLAYDPFAPSLPETVERAQERDEVFSRGDFVSLHLPANEQTRHCVGMREFQLMKPTAFLINCARGEVVDEPALIGALKDGVMAGAALDVFESEPPNPQSELFALGNCLLTPHAAAQTKEAADRMGLHAAQEIDRVLNGRAPLWPVNAK